MGAWIPARGSGLVSSVLPSSFLSCLDGLRLTDSFFLSKRSVDQSITLDGLLIVCSIATAGLDRSFAVDIYFIDLDLDIRLHLVVS